MNPTRMIFSWQCYLCIASNKVFFFFI
jgi:hypothetical protein